MRKMRTFALNPKGIPERMRTVLEASRTNDLPDAEKLKYFRAMVSETEREDIAAANYEDGFNDGMEKGMEKKAFDTARRMLAKGFDIADIVECSGLTEEQVRAL